MYNPLILKKIFSLLILFVLTLPPIQGIQEYLAEIDIISQRTIPQEQKLMVLNFYNTPGNVFPLDDEVIDERHAQFTKHRKKKLMEEFTENTGINWLTYSKTVSCTVDGEKICRQKGWNYDMHHIIPQTYNGPHIWWNVFPLTMGQHNKVHKDGSQCSILFPNSTGARHGGY